MLSRTAQIDNRKEHEMMLSISEPQTEESEPFLNGTEE